MTPSDVHSCRIVVRRVFGVGAHCQLRSSEHSLTVILVHGGGHLLEVSDATLGVQTD
jgi:hypothetical protein